MPETVVVGERFYTKPLLPVFFENGRFYILAVSQNGVRFFHGAHDGTSKIELPNCRRELKRYCETVCRRTACRISYRRRQTNRSSTGLPCLSWAGGRLTEF